MVTLFGRRWFESSLNDSNTKVLLHLDGTHGSTVITDSSGNGHNGTCVNGASLTTAQQKFGTASLILDGVNDYVSIADHADFAFGSGDFTIDKWIRPKTIPTPGNTYYLMGQTSGVSSASIYMILSLTNILGTVYVDFFVQNGPATSICLYRTPAPISANTWHHVAVVRNGTTGFVALDGNMSGSSELVAFGSNAMPDFTNILTIGALWYAAGLSSVPFDGCIDEVRIKLGAAWKGSFVPPARAYK